MFTVRVPCKLSYGHDRLDIAGWLTLVHEEDETVGMVVVEAIRIPIPQIKNMLL